MNELMVKLLGTGVLCWIWCNVWQLLEQIIDGVVVNRNVDNIMTLLAIPMMYITVSRILELFYK